ncbi:MAG: carbohydrate porin, partial [Bacteroidota bacterium]|nr:carbohydrate porin [Bacteroidota bacterium]
GVAGFPNGEVYRISDANPHVYIGRAYLKQIIPLSKEYEKAEDKANQLSGPTPTSYISIAAGKYSIMDFFDNNTYSHDPRTQFYNWALMGNGAWDYPANTRGYTYGLTFELVKPEWAVRFATVMVPKTANGYIMDSKISRSHSETLEFEKRYNLNGQKGTLRMISFLNNARMGSYKEALQWGISHNQAPQVDSTHVLGNTKFGLGLNIEQQINKYTGIFFRAGWNDGKNQTWAFTEIDRTISAGIALNGGLWKRNDDTFGFALIANGLSKDHKNYLKAGGYGFIIGDGTLNYRPEMISEIYYSFRLSNYPMWLSPDYQLILNPAYNNDRGPVHALGIRMHIEL